MKLTELFLTELEREADYTRRALAQVPDGKTEWKPHPKSMTLGYLAMLVATIPSWIEMTISLDELDLQPPGGQRKPEIFNTSNELLAALEKHVTSARKALSETTDEHLMTPWKLLVARRVVSEQPRHVVIRDAVFNHLAHHRGQLTVYLRLNDAKVPSIYGPSADENPWA